MSAVAGRAPVTYNRTFDDVRSVVERDGVFRYESGQRLDHRFFDDFAEYPFADVTGALDVPVALFHGTADDSVALADSLRAVGAFDTDVLFQAVPGEGHRFSEAAEARLQQQLFDWLALFD